MRDQEKLKKNVGTWRKRTKELLVEYKGGECEFCGYNKCIEALEFHHINENTKEFQISGSTKSLDTQKKEVDKCHILCANCHREVHAGLTSYHKPSNNADECKGCTIGSYPIGRSSILRFAMPYKHCGDAAVL